MFPESARQASNILPPRQGSVMALGVDGTSRAYDLTSIKLGTDFTKSGGANDCLYVSLFADGGDVYLALNNTNANAIDDTAKVAAGGSLAFANGYCAKLASGTQIDFRINRSVDKYLIVKCSGTNTATLRFYASSQPTASSTGL